MEKSLLLAPSPEHRHRLGHPTTSFPVKTWCRRMKEIKRSPGSRRGVVDRGETITQSTPINWSFPSVTPFSDEVTPCYLLL